VSPRFVAALLLWSLVATGVLVLVLVEGPAQSRANASEDRLIYAAALDSLTAGWGPPGGHPGDTQQIVVTSHGDDPQSASRELPMEIPTRKPILVVTPQTVSWS
jgi:hypothetical protein